MNKKELKETLHLYRVHFKYLPRKNKKVYTKAIDKLYKDLTKNNLYLKLQTIYPFI